MTLTNRLLAYFLSMLAFVLIGFSISLYLLAYYHLYKQVEDRLYTVLITLSGAIEAGPDGVEWEPANRHVDLDFGDQVVWVVADDRGQVLDQSKGKGHSQVLLDHVWETRPRLYVPTNRRWRGVSWEIGQNWIHHDLLNSHHVESSHATPMEGTGKSPAISVTAGISLIPVRTTLRQLAGALVGLSAIIWLVALVAGRFVCRRALFPVNRMAVAAGEINPADLSQRLPTIATKDELEELNRAFNSLLDRLQEAFERQQRFTGDASHQLRTPLTAILGQIEVVLRRNRPAEEYRQVLTTVQKRAVHLARMVEALLFLARADSDARLPVLEPLNLTTWLPGHLQTWSEHARASDLKVESDCSQACPINAQPALLGELLNILLDNACKYSEPGTPITVRLQQIENAACVQVVDQGYGIGESDLANLFVPFCRSEEARRRGIEGVGLGLSIAKRLAEIFGGTVTVESRPSQGSCFTLRLISRS